MSRDWNDPDYVKFRAEVRKRDKYTCRMCGSKNNLQVHHIIEWSEAYYLRYEVSNGITLCKSCHKSIKGHEKSWAVYFTNLIR